MIYNPETYKIPDEPGKPFIDDGEIEQFLARTSPSSVRVQEIIEKALNKNRLSMAETADLLNAENPGDIEHIKDAAKRLKENIYGDRIVLFAPLYIGNYCQNNCSYCGFKNSNKEIIRRTLLDQELVKEIRTLIENGHKRLILVYGEHQFYSPEFIASNIHTVYETKHGNGEIRRVNINAAPQDTDGFRIIKEAGIGTYQIFQETYHHRTYKKVHVSGRKSDYDWRLTALDRAQQAGIDDVGVGALFGLYNWKFETLGLIRHVNHLEAAFNVGPHTISFPRIQNAMEMKLDRSYILADHEFTRLIAILRLAVPYTGMILTAREPAEVRDEIMKYGISQIDGGTNIELGGYSQANEHLHGVNPAQFNINDDRTLNEVIHELLLQGFIPSFCTACYRMGRTGEHFMEFSVPGFIKTLCSPNAILTLAEYLEDYAPAETKELGYKLIDEKLIELESSQNIKFLKSKLVRVKAGERDLHF